MYSFHFKLHVDWINTKNTPAGAFTNLGCLANDGLSIFVERFWFHDGELRAAFQIEYKIFFYSREPLSKSLQNIHAIAVYFRLELNGKFFQINPV